LSKSNLRNHYKQKRKILSADDIENYSLDISNQLLKLPIWDFNYYHIFLPITSLFEVNTEYILNILLGKDKHVVIPKTDFKTLTLSHILLTDSTQIKKNKYDIPEPIHGIEIKPNVIQVVFVPLLAFDKTGGRIGYGKGFYDRFLADCNQDVLKIGLSFFEAEINAIDKDSHDVALDYCITPNTVYEFGS